MDGQEQSRSAGYATVGHPKLISKGFCHKVNKEK
jgi:hypothetical protein